MPVHRIAAIPAKFKQKKQTPTPGSVAEQIQQMKDRRAAAEKTGIKRPG